MQSIPSELIVDVERIASRRRLLLLQQPDIINEPQWSNQCKDGRKGGKGYGGEGCARITRRCAMVLKWRTVSNVSATISNASPIRQNRIPVTVFHLVAFSYKYERKSKRFMRLERRKNISHDFIFPSFESGSTHSDLK